MISICFAILLVFGVSAAPGYDVTFPSVLYVEPGSDWQLPCGSDNAGAINIIPPQDKVPSETRILKVNAGFHEVAERTTVSNEYKSASEEQEGRYACLVFHGPMADPLYTLVFMNVIVKDLCIDTECKALETCVPNYEAGIGVCICDYDHCGRIGFAMVCTNTCENVWNRCDVDRLNCADGIGRTVVSEGFCGPKVDPQYVVDAGELVVPVSALAGEDVTIYSGLDLDNMGSPAPSVSWAFINSELVESSLEVTSPSYTFLMDSSKVGTYIATVVYCGKEPRQVTTDVQLMETPSSSTGLDNLESTGAFPVCSVLPGGIIESFDGAGTYYDLACSHVLAANVLTGGTYADPWFVYGTFDEFEGKGALRSMTFYGSVGFEIQRGWLVNSGGSKVVLEEGVEQSIDGTGCSITFADLHLKVDCVHFIAYYDGIMAGHILMKGFNMENTAIVKEYGSFGLCYDSQSGFRKNWQVGNTVGVCEVSTEAEACPGVDALCGGLVESSRFGGASPATWGSCGNGATASCGELNCGDATPSVAQQCALNNANSANCNLKYGKEIEVDAACPDDCEWKNFVVDQGCPQENPPFECP